MIMMIVNVGVCVSAGIVFWVNFASHTDRFQVECVRGTSSLNTGWCEFGLFRIDQHARLTLSLWVTSKAKRVFKLRNVRLLLCGTRAQIKIYIFISSRLMSLIFGPSCCCYNDDNKNEKDIKTLIQTIGIYSQDIGMELAIEKCDTLIIRSKKKDR